MQNIKLTIKELKLLSSKPKTQILKLLQERPYTLSELSAKTGLKAPTMKEHVSKLVEAGFIEVKEEARKWKYYGLTQKGKQLVESNNNENAKVILVFSTIMVLIGVGLIFTIINKSSNQTQIVEDKYLEDLTSSEITKIQPQNSAGEVKKNVVESVCGLDANAINECGDVNKTQQKQ